MHECSQLNGHNYKDLSLLHGQDFPPLDLCEVFISRIAKRENVCWAIIVPTFRRQFIAFFLSLSQCVRVEIMMFSFVTSTAQLKDAQCDQETENI